MDISASLQTFRQKIQHFIKLQHELRLKLYGIYGDLFDSLDKMSMMNLQEIKKQGEKLTNIFQELQKILLQFQAFQQQTVAEIHELCEKYSKSLEDLGDNERNIASDLRKLLVSLEENLLIETEKAAVHKSL